MSMAGTDKIDFQTNACWSDRKDNPLWLDVQSGLAAALGWVPAMN